MFVEAKKEREGNLVVYVPDMACTVASIDWNERDRSIKVTWTSGSSKARSCHVFGCCNGRMSHCEEYTISSPEKGRLMSQTRLNTECFERGWQDKITFYVAFFSSYGPEVVNYKELLTTPVKSKTLFLNKSFEFQFSENDQNLCLRDFDPSIPMIRNIAIARFSNSERPDLVMERHYVFCAHHVSLMNETKERISVLEEDGSIEFQNGDEVLAWERASVTVVEMMVMPPIRECQDDAKKGPFDIFCPKRKVVDDLEKIFGDPELDIGHAFDRNSGCYVVEICSKKKRPVEATLALRSAGREICVKTGSGIVRSNKPLIIKFHASELLGLENNNCALGVWISDRYHYDYVPFSMIYGDEVWLIHLLRYLVDLYNHNPSEFSKTPGGSWIEAYVEGCEPVTMWDLFALCNRPLYLHPVETEQDMIDTLKQFLSDQGEILERLEVLEASQSLDGYRVMGTNYVLRLKDGGSADDEDDSRKKDSWALVDKRTKVNRTKVNPLDDPRARFYELRPNKIPLYEVEIVDWTRSQKYLVISAGQYLVCEPRKPGGREPHDYQLVHEAFSLRVQEKPARSQGYFQLGDIWIRFPEGQVCYWSLLPIESMPWRYIAEPTGHYQVAQSVQAPKGAVQIVWQDDKVTRVFPKPSSSTTQSKTSRKKVGPGRIGKRPRGRGK